MALQSFTVSIGALRDANNNDKNYVSGEPVYVKTTGGTFAPIFRDLAGTSEISQDGLANQTNEKGQFTFYVEAGDYILEYQNQSTPVTVVGADYFNNRVEETVNQIIIDTATSRGFRVVGDFASGFTYELPNDVAIDGSGNYWIYADSGALPFVVTAGTTPSAPTYTQVTFNQASGVTTTAGINAQQFIDNFELKIFQSPTDNLTKISTFAGGVGVVYEVRKTSDDSLATIYSDAAGTTEIIQNGTSNKSGSDGVVKFYIAGGDYYVEVDSVKSNFKVKKLESFNSVSEMKSFMWHKEGDVVSTKRYHSELEGGGASYLVSVLEPSDKHSEILDNGLYAVLVNPIPSTRQLGFIGTGLPSDRANDISVLDSIFSTYKEISLSSGVYPDYKIVNPNLTLYSTKDVIFKLADGTSGVGETEAKMTLEIAAINVTINGDITVDGNSFGNSNTSTSTSDRRGAFAVNHDRFKLNGAVIIPDAYWVGVSIGHNGKIAFDVEIETIRHISSESYNFHAWNCDRWKVGTIFSEDTVQDFNNRIQTGSQSISSAKAQHGEIGSILGRNAYVVIEVNTDGLDIGFMTVAGWKTEEANAVTIGTAISKNTSFNAWAFGMIRSSNCHVETIICENYQGAQVRSGNFASNTNCTVGSVKVTGNTTADRDMEVLGNTSMHFGDVILKGVGSDYGLYLDYDPAFEPFTDIVIDSITSLGHGTLDIEVQNYQNIDVTITRVNDGATSNWPDLARKGEYIESAVNLNLNPATGSITTSSATVSFTKIGRLVHAQGLIAVSAVSDPSGILKLEGFTYPASDLTGQSGVSVPAVYVKNLAAGATGAIQGIMLEGSSDLELYINDDGAQKGMAQFIQAGTQIGISFSYISE